MLMSNIEFICAFPIFSAMGNWHSIYHEALLVRLASMVVIFVVLGPALWMLLVTGFRLTRRFVQRIGHNTRLGQGHLS